MSKASKKREAQEEAREHLREILSVGDRVQTVLLHVNSEGTSRVIAPVVALLDRDGNPYARNISSLVATATGSRYDNRRNGVRVGGGGMDMGYHLVYGLSRALWPEGHPCTGRQYATNQGDPEGPGHRCPSNDHSNEREADYTPGRVHRDGGYALNQSWL